MVSYLLALIHIAIWAVPIGTLVGLFSLVHTTVAKIVLGVASPVIFATLYVTTAGLLSRIGIRAIVPGVFPRKLDHPVYQGRRIYGAAWTAIYYFLPLYHLCLAIPPLKKWMFRLFGYQFETKFIVYPDTWIRDFPCLKFERGVYLSNKSSIGTNMCLIDGNILVDRVKMGKGSMLGHGSMIGPGANTKENCEISVDVVIGIRTKLMAQVKMGGASGVSHGCVIGEGTELGDHAYVGIKCVLGDHLRIPAAANIPAGSQIASQEEFDRFYQQETEDLNLERKRASKRSPKSRGGGVAERTKPISLVRNEISHDRR